MLKQDFFFKAIKKQGLTINQYAMLYHLYANPILKPQQEEAIRKSLPADLLLSSECILTDKAKAIIKSFEKYFASTKSLSTAAAATPEFVENLKTYIELFPTGKLPSGKHARGDKKNVEKNMLWFFTEFDYSWEVVLQATQTYINEYRNQSTPYMYMMTAMYFVVKEKNKQLVSELANYCSLIQEGYVIEQPRIFKTRVV